MTDKQSDGANGNTAAAPTGVPNVTPNNANIAFVRNTITNLLRTAPNWTRVIVLFLFVMLFFYIVLFTMQGSMVVPTTVQVALTEAEISEKLNRGIFVAPEAYKIPDLRYQISYNGNNYGLNGEGGTRVDLSFPMYMWVLARRQFGVSVRTPDGITSHQIVEISGLASGSIFFRTPAGKPAVGQLMGAIQPPWREGALELGAVREWHIISRAHADELTGGRLYLQSITLAQSASVDSVNATLISGNQSYSLTTLSSDLGSQVTTPIAVKGGASIVQDYRTFFALSGPQLQPNGQIKFEAPLGFFRTAYSETFTLPTELHLGSPTKVNGSNGSVIVVQLAYPIDVVFFERRDTAVATEQLASRVAALGFSPRININAANTPGSYNIIYSGKDVPNSALRKILSVVAGSGINLHFIQPQIGLSNGLQNQIQIGSNPKVACLPSIDPSVLKSLAHSDADFSATVGTLPSPTSC